MRFDTPFGDNCHGNIGYEHCSKCWNRLKDYHVGNQFGPHCIKEISPQSKHSDWHTANGATNASAV